jgi:integrase
MAQHRIPRGDHGLVVARQQPDGRWLARAQVRDVDGRIRSVRTVDRTKGAAIRRLEGRLSERADPSVIGLSSRTTLDTLATVWLQHRRDHGQVRKRGPLAAQTLATYSSEIEHVIVPAIGGVRLQEVTVPFLDRLFADVEHGRAHGRYAAREGGRSTRQLRVVLGGMLALAVTHGALPTNPIRDASPSVRATPSEVQFLTIRQAVHLREHVQRAQTRLDGRRMENRDLEDFVNLLLGTGCREGEALAIRLCDLEALDSTLPVLHVCGTVIEPRRGFVPTLHRQDTTKTRQDRRLILPDATVAMFKERLRRSPPQSAQSPVFATRTGNWTSPANMRGRFRRALERAADSDCPAADDLAGTTLHTLRRTVGTLLAHEVGLDAAREQLGHRDPSVTYQHYVGRRTTAPDVRPTLDQLLVPLNDPSRCSAAGASTASTPL